MATYTHSVNRSEAGDRPVKVYPISTDSTWPAIDEEDFLFLIDVFNRHGMGPDPLRRTTEAKLGEKQRICKICFPVSRCYRRHVSLPASIGRLQNLTEMYLLGSQLWELPQAIGDLGGLRKLDISWTDSIHPCIGQLKQLTYLKIRKGRIDIPEQIGSLVCLEHLSIENVESIPSSIGRLGNLRELVLYRARVSSLPEEIGDLVCLEQLNLARSNITSLPASIGNLLNLKRLHLRRTKKLVHIPEQIGNLSNLQYISLYGSETVVLPASARKLEELKRLELFYPPERIRKIPPREKYSAQFLLDTAKQYRSLGSFGEERKFFELINFSPDWWKVLNVLQSNRARFRLWPWNRGNASIRLWPMLIKNAARAFEPYRPTKPSLWGLVKTPDAIYRLISEGQEPFVMTLIERYTNI